MKVIGILCRERSAMYLCGRSNLSVQLIDRSSYPLTNRDNLPEKVSGSQIEIKNLASKVLSDHSLDLCSLRPLFASVRHEVNA